MIAFSVIFYKKGKASKWDATCNNYCNFFQFLKLYIFSHFKTKGKLLVCVYLLYLVILEYFYSITKTVFLRLNILLKIENK